MGLCKCSKRKVTNLFCFVHRVNVCEECMIADHQRCIVRSYLQWLQDSDYEPVCILCNQSLKNGEIVRLCCLDLFHVDCLEKYVQTSSNGTSLASIKCPSCKDAFFPPNNMVSPVSNRFRETMKSYWWGREGLGMADEEYYNSEDEPEEEIMTDTINNDVSDVLDPHPHMTSTPMVCKTVSSSLPGNRVEESHDYHMNLQLYDKPLMRSVGHPTAPADIATDPSGSGDNIPRSSQHTTSSSHQGYYVPLTNDDDKYTRKNPLQAVGRWYRNHTAWSTPVDNSNATMKRYVLLVLLFFFFVVTLIVLMTRVGQKSGDHRTSMDWKFNPQIKTGQ